METGYLIIPEPHEGIKGYKEICNRFCSAIYMASRISEKAGKYIITEPAMQCAYVRATLAEFCSIEECIKQLYPKLDNKQYLIHKSNNPAFHLLKLLRNYNIHLSDSTLSEKSISIALACKPDIEHDMSVWYIDNLDSLAISKLASAKYYSIQEIEKFIEIFDEKQHEFGIAQLLMTIVVQYSEYISKLLTCQSTLAQQGNQRGSQHDI